MMKRLVLIAMSSFKESFGMIVFKGAFDNAKSVQTL